VDHGGNGLISVIGAKYTMARHVAEKVVDRVFESRQQTPPKSRTSVTPIHGGEIENFGTFLQNGSRSIPNGFDNSAGHRLLNNYGSAFREVCSNIDKPLVANGNRFSPLRAEVLHGIREEMAQTLSDVVFRRTDLGTAGHPGHGSLRACAEEMRNELGWSDARTRQELQEVNNVFTFSN